jgi:type IV pilus assembly protein PilB
LTWTRSIPKDFLLGFEDGKIHDYRVVVLSKRSNRLMVAQRTQSDQAAAENQFSTQMGARLVIAKVRMLSSPL